MDIRTKLALALVSVALASMAILGAFAYKTTASLMQEMSVRQLNALAESKKRDLDKVQEGWRDQLRLIKSRTQLREDLKHYLDTGDKESILSVTRIIEDAVSAVDDVDKIRILDLQGKEVVSYGTAPDAAPSVIPDDSSAVVYNNTLIDSAGKPVVVFASTLNVDGKPIGVIQGTFNTNKLRSITGNYTGLGKSGEVMVMMKYGDSVQLLNPLRHESSDILARVPMSKTSAAVKQALSATQPAQEWLTAVDYRGVNVWAATRYVPELKWGIVVKVDESEERVRAETLKNELFDIGLSLSAFAIVGGTALGFYLARPIHDLAEIVKRIRHGETGLRANVSGDDEITYLAESLNDLMDHMRPDAKEPGPDG